MRVLTFSGCNTDCANAEKVYDNQSKTPLQSAIVEFVLSARNDSSLFVPIDHNNSLHSITFPLLSLLCFCNY